MLLAVINWIGGTGDWNIGSNWSNGVGPGAGDNAVIDVAGNITVTHSSGDHTIQSLTANDGFTLAGGTLSTLVNCGTIQADTAGGTLIADYGSGGGTATGNLKALGGTLTVRGNWKTGSTEVTGGTLNLGGSFTQADLVTFTRASGGTAGNVHVVGTLSGGLTLNDTLGSWFLNAGTLTGGALNVAPGSSAKLVVTGAGSNAITNVALNAGLDMQSMNGAFLNFNSGSTLNQTLNLGNAAATTVGNFGINGNLALSGTGTVVFGAHPSNYLGCRVGGQTTTIATGITLRGHSGTIGGGGTCSLVNQGTIQADTPGGTLRVERC